VKPLTALRRVEPGSDQPRPSVSEDICDAPSLRESPAQRLDQLVGLRVMNFVPHLDLRHPIDPDANGCMFGLDGVVYMAFEDPSDGYRSHCGPLLSYVGDPYQMGGSLWPDHLALSVLCSMEGEGEDILTMRSVETGSVVFEVGTDNSKDYYPSFVMRWTPPGNRKDGSSPKTTDKGGE
jgi:hypothetical protein